MSDPINSPQPPKVLKTPVEIHANLRQLLQNHDPLIITFHERNQQFRTYLVEVDRDRGLLALDEMIPSDGERFLNNGELFHVESSHDGVRIAWDCDQPADIGELEGTRCYWCSLPTEMLYHQRRNAYRAITLPGQPVSVELSGERLSLVLKGQLIDISATGCKLRFPGDISARLHSGEVYERLTIQLPFGTLVTPIEIRHAVHDVKLDATFAGTRFHRIGGLEQRNIERFVYQLQREARRTDKDDL
ncbi:flagellar brake protein [Pseudomonas mangiferae]|uniref:Pilus assembly protein PilZ n=1 Tax=Pseudomonas mangiferae TaxID=2593654 RepID=A0A553GUV1_9PSED|nr:flagellar brake protein [Pseudomonas mangiferae]TRX73271.1 pilus assembly protein PilZ [Pseudomonas mangiferae]